MAKRKRRQLKPRFDIEPSQPPVRQGMVTPMRPVPMSIERPPYLATGGNPAPSSASSVRTDEEIGRMRVAGSVAAEILLEVGSHVAPGVTTEKLDQIAHDAYVARGAYPSPLGYKGFPKSVCTSVNEIICHGIPDSRQLQAGDIVNIDVTAYIGGVHGDTSTTFLVGDVADPSRHLVQVTHDSLQLAIDQVRPGARFNEIGTAIENHATRNGVSVVRDFIGHGVGTEFHTSLQIPHYYVREFVLTMEQGMSFTIEPMLNLGDLNIGQVWDDEWTAPTVDGCRSAQFEHTMVVTADGVEIMTKTAAGECAHDQYRTATV